ncbi:polysaccharide lyase [Kitasatospora purpeofusca]|uniref:polysaccharide lyase n=1 Tax=Kitasatospora purpeofusca TaxID=67352 RepID=UPI0022529ECB|nr:polysaccharide lyase [Kitasatospora purpeofusca]MCX4682941.1 polysaccharide lyase [Kitasatospora purpeofusca]
MPPLRSRPTTTATARRTAGAVSVALLTVGAAVTPAAAATDSRSYDFESLGAQDWPFRAINGFGAVNTAPAPPGGAGTAARFNVPADGTSFRAELALKGLSAESHRFAFANYLPKDWKQVDDDTIVAQWFSTQPGNEGVKPVVALSVHGGDWRLKVHWLKDLATFEEYETVIQLGAAQFGRWNRWALDITWSTRSTPGSITVTRDGVQVGAHRGDNNYHRGEPPHFRTGIYRPAWRPEKKAPPAGGPDVVLYVDDIAITPVPATPPTPPNTPTPSAPPAPPTPAKPTATTGPTPGPSPSTAASAPPASPSATPAPVLTSAAPPSAVPTPAPPTTVAPSPAAPAPTPQDTLALAIDRPVPTTTKELSTTGTGAGVAVAFAGGTVAVVLGTFLIRRRKPGAHRRGSTPQD